jgi:hypothetical protein
MLRTERAITTIATSKVYADELRDIVRKQVLIQHEWEIAVALREITELLSDLASGYAEGVGGPMTTAVLMSQNRAISIAKDATTTRVVALESLAEQVAAAEAARRDWETAPGWPRRSARSCGRPPSPPRLCSCLTRLAGHEPHGLFSAGHRRFSGGLGYFLALQPALLDLRVPAVVQGNPDRVVQVEAFAAGLPNSR